MPTVNYPPSGPCCEQHRKVPSDVRQESRLGMSDLQMRLRVIHFHTGGGGWVCLYYCSELHLKVRCRVEDRPRSVSDVITAGKARKFFP